MDLLYRLKGLRIYDQQQLPRLVQSDSAPLRRSQAGRSLRDWVPRFRKLTPPATCFGTRFLVRHCMLWKFREIAPVFYAMRER